MKPLSLMGATALLAFAPISAVAQDAVMTWGKPAEITGFDVHVAGTVASWEMYQMVYETLLTTNADLGLAAGLAEKWEQTSPTTYTLTLRDGAAFSNGRAVTSDDVIGSLERIKNPETASYWSPQLGDIARMEATDDRVIEIELASPQASFLPALAHITAAILPMKELEDGSFDPTSQMLGSGPFMVEEHKQDESWTLARNPHYWREGYPLADTLEVPIIPDESARIAALRDGRIDFTTFENPDAQQMLSSAGNVAIDVQQTTNYYRLDVNALDEASPFHDKRVRQAMNLALDRDAINDFVFAGTSSPDYPVPAAFGKDACRNLDTYAMPRDERLEKARGLLEEAGNTSPEIALTLSSANPVLGRIGQVVQQSLGEAGFDVSLNQVPTAEYLQKVFTDGDFDFSASWLAGYTDPGMVIKWWNPEFAVWNAVFHENVPELSQALDDVGAMQDGAERDAKLTEICAMIDDGANILALVGKSDYLAYREDQVDVTLAERSGSANTYQFIAEFDPK
ncbi:peptide/nickel transport system substrate-binding protein [Roseovarius nanhaiticus]|uniref:Peptide/nickel transport system substrate-binding protein n=1 Tax=Roseovarius nanhaiticus TaxID=573024 RepID=A0A1N7ES27_9RHOB|nr:ABC transporter substrate-binding protein [Roseovarius nanhaiticus]SEK67746.1 peptide/nickel transport system substrate-binding protein [Roseovarius nanhaiticus]SIR90891.1 peptide/nickel transport system substrate-binding protein [Roseovarius nanhaiticus]